MENEKPIMFCGRCSTERRFRKIGSIGFHGRKTVQFRFSCVACGETKTIDQPEVPELIFAETKEGD